MPVRWRVNLLLLFAVWTCWGLQQSSTATAASLPEDLDKKPLIEQLLARKAFLAEHMKSDEWKR